MGEKVVFHTLLERLEELFMALFTLAAETAAGILSDAGMTILIGFVVVFGVLLLLTGVFKAFGAVMSSFGEKAETASAPAPTVAPAPVAPAVDLGPVMSSAQVRNGIKPEETAVIAAAVAASMPAGQKYTITKIDRAE